MTEILKEAKRLHAFGCAILWLHPKSKRPIGDGWASGPRKSWEQLSKEYREGMNVGVRLGTPSRIVKANDDSGDANNKASFLAAIDCDVKSKEKRHLVEMRTALKKLCRGKELPRVASGRGGGSAHLYCRTRKAFKTFTPYRSKELVEYQSPSKTPSKKEVGILGPAKIAKGIRLGPAWEISLYSDGRQCVLPPSIHPDSGREYRWEVFIHSALDAPLLKFDLPDEAVQDDKTEPKSAKTVDAKFSFLPEEIDVSWLPGISDEVRDGIVSGHGVDDRSEFLLKATSALHSVGLKRNQILSVFTDPENYISSCGFEHTQSKDRKRAAYWLWKYTVRKVLLERPGNVAFDDKPKSAPKKLSKKAQKKQAAEIAAMTSWRDELEKTKQNKVMTTLSNVALIFDNKAEGVFVRDLFANRLVYGQSSPWEVTGGKPRKKGQLFEDIDLSLIRSWLSEKFGFEPPANLVYEVSQLAGFRNSVHPVRRWVKSLEWDGTPRIDTWIKDYCKGKAPEPYLSNISRKFLVAMVSRIFKPGCQWDYVLVLEGEQGKRKSTVARTLAGDAWFMDNLPDLRDKDAMINLQGKWVVELGELADVKRSDYNLVKQYLARRSDTVRAPYGKVREDLQRQSVFIGTVNEGQYLRDPTGNRRYWPVKVGMCDVKGLGKVREQLFAEAYQVYLKGEKLFLDEVANLQATAAQEKRRVHDDSSEMKDRLLEFLHTEEGDYFLKNKFRSRELFEGVNSPWGQWKPQGWQLNIAATVLHTVGFKDTRRADGNYWAAPFKMHLNGSGRFEWDDGEKGVVTKKETTLDFY